MIARALLIGSMSACLACSVDAGGNAAQRCAAQAECGAGRQCYAGFCLDDGTEQQGDPASDGREDAEMAPAPEPETVDAATPVASDDAADEDADDAAEDDEQGESGGLVCTLEVCCQAGLCCKSSQLICDFKCVNPDKDKHHCGGCGNACEHGAKCKDGVCEEDS